MRKRVEPDVLTSQLGGREISHLSAPDERHVNIHFTDGTVLLIEAGAPGIVTTVSHRRPDQPTKRQSDYLRFISKYIHQFGRAPAESDIQRHFLVSAPSVNQMMQTLERRGFITREPGVARSIRLCAATYGDVSETWRKEQG
jgi:hypothetical protein